MKKKNKKILLSILIVSIIVSCISFKKYNVYSINLNNSCNLKIKDVNYYYDKAKDTTYAQIAISFNWNNNSNNLNGKDIIGIAWNEEVNVDGKKSYINIKYTDNTNEIIQKYKGIRLNVNLYKFVFPQEIKQNKTYNLVSGEGVISLSKRGNHPKFTIYAEYGNSVLDSNLKVTLEDRFTMQFSEGISVKDYASLTCSYK